MATERNGLRFDIYERVHLSEGAAGIMELEGVELVPHIQVLAQGEHAMLRGNLIVSGTYVDEEGRSEQSLEHLIPVEITLPMNRVTRMEDISVEIETFDVDVLSARSLNITGVLSLNGLEVCEFSESSSDSELAWRNVEPSNEEEEVIFVHEAAPQQAQTREPVFIAEAAPQAEEEENLDPRNEEAPVPAPAKEEKKANEEVEAPASVPAPAPVPSPEPAAEEAEQAKDLKVGFGTKKPSVEAPESAPAAAGKGSGLSSLINFTASRPNPLAVEEPSPDPNIAAEKVEWKNLLLSSQGAKQEFKKVRLVIVQKEETLETIAKRYDLSPREIALYNRLGESELAAGQIVYLPR